MGAWDRKPIKRYGGRTGRDERQAYRINKETKKTKNPIDSTWLLNVAILYWIAIIAGIMHYTGILTPFLKWIRLP